MKKLSLILFLLVMVLFAIALNTNVWSYAQPQLENSAAASSGSPAITAPAQNASTSLIEITDTAPYTIYLPIVAVPLHAKKGVAAVAYPACDDIYTLRAGWYFNWGIDPDPTCGGVDPTFVPRLYNADSMARLSEAVANAQASGWLMGFSEPNLLHQGNMTPRDGARYWKQIEDAVAGTNIKLVSPSPNQWEPNTNGQIYGYTWLWEMVEEFEDMYGRRPRFDAIGWNIYANNHADIETYLTARRQDALNWGYNVPIWVLEYGGRCWANDGNMTVMQTTTAWFNATPWIGRYAWYANRLSAPESGTGVDYSSCTLINPTTSQLTSLGQVYFQY